MLILVAYDEMPLTVVVAVVAIAQGCMRRDPPCKGDKGRQRDVFAMLRLWEQKKTLHEEYSANSCLRRSIISFSAENL